MTQAKQCTVVITTHYIDEARGANVVSNLLHVINYWGKPEQLCFGKLTGASVIFYNA